MEPKQTRARQCADGGSPNQRCARAAYRTALCRCPGSAGRSCIPPPDPVRATTQRAAYMPAGHGAKARRPQSPSRPYCKNRPAPPRTSGASDTPTSTTNRAAPRRAHGPPVPAARRSTYPATACSSQDRARQTSSPVLRTARPSRSRLRRHSPALWRWYRRT